MMDPVASAISAAAVVYVAHLRAVCQEPPGTYQSQRMGALIWLYRTSGGWARKRHGRSRRERRHGR